MKRLFLLGAILGCGGKSDTSLPIEAQCNPLGVNHCMTPWPSSVYEVDDATTMTGRKLAIPAGTLPTNTDGIAADPSGWNTADGFSPAAPMVMSFPGGVSIAGLPPSDNMDLSLAADSPTVIYDMTAGARVAHFAEVDAQADMADQQALFLRPAQRLIGGHRYAVAITNKVKAKDGTDLVSPPGFQALVSGTKTDHALLEGMRARFDDVLDALDGAGFPAEELIVAWDFTVASDDYVHRDVLTARKRALDALATHPIAFTITSDEVVGDGTVTKRRISGNLDAPLFLTNNGNFDNHTVLARDADGLPALQGFYQIPFNAIVPTCAYGAAAKVGMIMYGHGLMGSSNEATGGVQQATASETCNIIIGTDMRGMSTQDLPAVARALNDMSRADEVMDVLVQGMVNHITLAHALHTTMQQTLFVDGTGAPLADASKVYYYGLSQGAIFGTAVMAYEPTITRGVLGVGAANYSELLDRSADWPMYRTILAGGYPDALDCTLAISMFQMRWDKVEGSGVANSVLAGDQTMTPPKQILLQIALGDEQVPNIGSYWLARSMGLPILGPTPATPWGLSVKTGPLTGSALQIMDGGAPPNPVTNIPAPEQDPSMHDLTRTQPATRREMKTFYATGMLTDECAGPCVCQDNACK